MKISLSSHQPAEYLRKADEIYIKENDVGVAYDLHTQYPNIPLVIENIPVDLPNTTVVISSLDRIPNQPWFYKYPATTAYELEALIRAGASQVRIDAPLFFDLRDWGIPVRVFANTAHQGYLPFDGTIGSYIRPEDLGTYSLYVDTIEFYGCNTTQEQALYRIYSKGEWPGRLDDIITGVNTPKAYNSLIPPDFAKARMHCQQKCTAGSACQLCKRYLNLADKELYNELQLNADPNE